MKININKLTTISIFFVNGLKQTTKDLDFYILPTLTFLRADKTLSEYGKAYGIGLRWGHWAIVLAVYFFKQ